MLRGLEELALYGHAVSISALFLMQPDNVKFKAAARIAILLLQKPPPAWLSTVSRPFSFMRGLSSSVSRLQNDDGVRVSAAS